jgi:hypothetical protein
MPDAAPVPDAASEHAMPVPGAEYAPDAAPEHGTPVPGAESAPDGAPIPAAAQAPAPAADPSGADSTVPDPTAPDLTDPDPTALDLIATPAALRRAPKYWAFIRAGILLGAIVGAVAATLTPRAADEPRAAVIWLTALSLAALGALLGGAFAVLADRRSRPKR